MWRNAFADPSHEDSIDVLVALAAVQMECGYLQVDIRELALASLASPGALALWSATPDLKKRSTLLRRFEQSLRELDIDKQRPRIKRARTPYAEKSVWVAGDCLLYSPFTGPTALLVVFHLLEGSNGETAPVVGLLALRGWSEVQATPADLANIPFLAEAPSTVALLRREGLIKGFEVHQTARQRAPLDRIVKLDQRRPIAQHERAGLCAVQTTWRELEGYLSSDAA
jgi:hypothetical protein